MKVVLWLELEHWLQQGAVQGLGKGIKLKPELWLESEL